MNNKINLFFAVDNNYSTFLSVTLNSIMDNANPNYYYDCYVLDNGVHQVHKDVIEYQLKDNFKIIWVDMKEKLTKFEEKLHTRDYYSKSTYFRLFIPNMFPQLDKALYLDSDIVVLGDISELYNTELGSNLVGAITDSAVQNTPIFKEYVKEVIGVNDDKDYFNAGVLLMNLKQMRKENFEEKFFDMLSSYTFTVAQDQDYLNAICLNRVTKIDYSWNTMPIPENVVKVDKLNLIHYNMLWKPWIFDNTLYEDYFWKYAKTSPFYKTILRFKEMYPEEKKQKDLSGGAKLLELCKQEILRPDNYKKKFLK